MEHGQGKDERPAGFWMGVLILGILVASLASFVVAAHIWWLQPLASVQGFAIDEMFNLILVATGIAFIVVHVFLGIALMRYGARRGERAAHWHEHLGAELTWTIVPAIGFIVLAIAGEIVWANIYSPPPANAEQIEVVGRQFEWYVRYAGPDGQFARTDPVLISASNPLGIDPKDPRAKQEVIALNELHLVTGRPVAIRVTAIDVIHSLFLPNFRVKQDAVPGRLVQIWFTPNKPGRYQMACAQLCGVGHYTMRGNVTVGTQRDLDAWLKAQPKP